MQAFPRMQSDSDSIEGGGKKLNAEHAFLRGTFPENLIADTYGRVRGTLAEGFKIRRGTEGRCGGKR